MSKDTTTKAGERTQNKLAIGERFNMGAIRCDITSTATFSGTLHYGFTYMNDNGKFGCGWMPCEFVERFAGYNPNETQGTHDKFQNA